MKTPKPPTELHSQIDKLLDSKKMSDPAAIGFELPPPSRKATTVSVYELDNDKIADIRYDKRFRAYKLSLSAVIRLAINKLNIDEITQADLEKIRERDMRRS